MRVLLLKFRRLMTTPAHGGSDGSGSHPFGFFAAFEDLLFLFDVPLFSLARGGSLSQLPEDTILEILELGAKHLDLLSRIRVTFSECNNFRA
jgi:hypothetical protein